MFNKYKLLLSFILFFFVNLLFSNQVKIDQALPQKIMYYSPDVKFENTIEKNIDFIVKLVLKKLSKEKKISFVEEISYQKYLENYNLNDPYKIADFYNLTKISGSIDILIINEITSYKISIIANDILNNTTRYSIINVNPDSILQDMNKINAEIEKFIISQFPIFSLFDLEKLETSRKNILRNNPFFALNYTFDSGFLIREFNDNYPYYIGAGPVVSNEFLFKINKLYIKNSIVFSFIFTDNIEDKNSYIKVIKNNYEPFSFITDFRFELSIGVLNKNELFGFGFGTNYLLTNLYATKRFNESTRYDKIPYSLIMLYFNFLFKPDNNIVLSVDCGSFFSIDYFTSMYPSSFFPLYLKPSFKYVFYKNLFFDISLPFFLINYDLKDSVNSNSKPSTILQIQTGIGWKIERSKK